MMPVNFTLKVKKMREPTTTTDTSGPAVSSPSRKAKPPVPASPTTVQDSIAANFMAKAARSSRSRDETLLPLLLFDIAFMHIAIPGLKSMKIPTKKAKAQLAKDQKRAAPLLKRRLSFIRSSEKRFRTQIMLDEENERNTLRLSLSKSPK